MTDPAIPPALSRAVADDLAPVRPLWSPGRRALVLLPVVAGLLLAIPGFWGLRSNVATLGLAAAWGLSALQALAGLGVIGLALREAVPGRTISSTALALAGTAAAALFVTVTLVSESVAPTVVPAGVWLRFAWECFGMSAASGLPGLALVGWMVARALPTRPFVAGALYGLGAALIADAGVRLFCWVSTPSHVLVAHGASIAALTLAGSTLASAVEAVRSRRAPRVSDGGRRAGL